MDSAQLQHLVNLALARNYARPMQLGEWHYVRLNHKCEQLPEGTALFGDKVIWGYPKIGRIVRLDTGIAAQIKDNFWVEEKIDGYNVRVFRYQDDVLALTRRGYICPFTTDRLLDLLDTRILAERPELVLCAEVAGPENPYNEGSPPFIREDVQLFIFDIMRQGEPGFLPYAEKLKLLKTYNLPSVPQFGQFFKTDLEKLKHLLLKLNDEHREGVVLKEDAPGGQRVKYVTGNINVDDIQLGEQSVWQLPAEYYMHRILRLALFMDEHGILPTPALCQRLGKSLIEGILDAAAQYRDQHKVSHTYRCRFRHRTNAQLMLDAMERLLGEGQVRHHRLEQVGEFYVLEFAKILPRTTGMLAHSLSGGIVFD